MRFFDSDTFVSIPHYSLNHIDIDIKGMSVWPHMGVTMPNLTIHQLDTSGSLLICLTKFGQGSLYSRRENCNIKFQPSKYERKKTGQNKGWIRAISPAYKSQLIVYLYVEYEMSCFYISCENCDKTLLRQTEKWMKKLRIRSMRLIFCPIKTTYYPYVNQV